MAVSFFKAMAVSFFKAMAVSFFLRRWPSPFLVQKKESAVSFLRPASTVAVSPHRPRPLSHLKAGNLGGLLSGPKKGDHRLLWLRTVQTVQTVQTVHIPGNLHGLHGSSASRQAD
jgi:hypothetical protein